MRKRVFNSMDTDESSKNVIVAKIGSNAITKINEDGTQEVDPFVIESFARGVKKARDFGFSVVIVSSGAVAGGMYLQHFRKRPGLGEANRLSSLAAIGQTQLMSLYSEKFAEFDISVAQCLPTQSDFHSDVVNEHMKATLLDLLDLDVVPIFNENDFTSYAEMRFGDNDLIASLVSILLGAKHLVLFTNQDGVFDKNPENNTDAILIENLDELSPDMFDESQEKSAAGSGGINSKLYSGDLCRYFGIETSICNVSEIESLLEVVQHNIRCSRFLAIANNDNSIEEACKIVSLQTSERDHPFFSVGSYLNKS